jgi:hypothetical protein
MKNREIIFTVFPALCGVIVLAATLIITEMKLWLMEQWMVVFFFFGLFLVSLSLIAMWVRFILRGLINDYFLPLNKEIIDLRKKYDNLADPDPETRILSGLNNSLAKSLLVRIIRFFI